MSAHTVLVVDDEPMLRNLLSHLLHLEGYKVLEAEDGLAALDVVATENPDLVLLDVMLPARNGLDVLGDLRRTSDIPVILVSARAEEDDRVAGLRLGADDYVTKPFSAAELSARVASLLRRSVMRRSPATSGGRLAFEGLAIDLRTREVRVAGARVEMTAKEFDLLAYLARSNGAVVTKRELLGEVWRQPYGGADKTVDVHLSWLRRKLGESASAPRYLHTVRGVGVKLVPPSE